MNKEMTEQIFATYHINDDGKHSAEVRINGTEHDEILSYVEGNNMTEVINSLYDDVTEKMRKATEQPQEDIDFDNLPDNVVDYISYLEKRVQDLEDNTEDTDGIEDEEDTKEVRDPWEDILNFFHHDFSLTRDCDKDYLRPDPIRGWMWT